MAKHTLFLPRYRPPLANAWRGQHWSKAHKLRDEAVDLLCCYALQQRVPAAKGRRKVALLVRLGPRMKRSDKDSFDKLLLDALKGAGLLLDDSERGLEGRVEVAFERGTAADWGTRIDLEDVE